MFLITFNRKEFKIILISYMFSVLFNSKYEYQCEHFKLVVVKNKKVQLKPQKSLLSFNNLNDLN